MTTTIAKNPWIFTAGCWWATPNKENGYLFIWFAHPGSPKVTSYRYVKNADWTILSLQKNAELHFQNIAKSLNCKMPSSESMQRINFSENPETHKNLELHPSQIEN